MRTHSLSLYTRWKFDKRRRTAAQLQKVWTEK